MEGVRCWDGHTTAHTPNEMHQSSGEGMGVGFSCWVEVRLVQRDQGGKGMKHGSGQGAGPTLSLCPSYLPMAQTWATVGLGEWLRPFSQEGGVRVGSAPCFCRSSSQCHSTNNK